MTNIGIDELLDKSAIEQLLSLLSEDEVNNILRSCLEDAETRVSNLKNLRLPADILDLQRNAHDLKSTAGQLGAARLSKIAEELDVYCKSLCVEEQPDLDFLESRRKEIIHIFADVADAINNTYLNGDLTNS